MESGNGSSGTASTAAKEEPQQQEGPGWGFLYQQRDYLAGATPPSNTNTIPTMDKAANFERDRALFRDLLNSADRPWQPADATTPGRTASQEHTHHREPDPDHPPPVPHSHECEVTYYDLTHGCHSIHVTLLDSATSHSSSSSHSSGKLPHVIVAGDAGLLATAPPFPEGTTGTFAPMATNMWLLVLT